MKKGISLVSLMVTMVIMISIISTVTISGFSTLNNNKKIVFATEINMIQSAVDTYRTKNNGELPVSGKVQLNVSKVTDRAREQFNDEIYLTTNLIELYKIDYSILGITSLRYGTSEDGDTDIYVASKNTGKVYYAKGLAVGLTTYYTLTDDLRKIIKASDENEVYDGIKFNVSTDEWTLDKVITEVKVPNIYTNVTVSILGETDTYNSKAEGNYNVYTINNLESNYVITVNYTKDGKTNTVEYTVDNVDNVPPSISSNNVKEGSKEEEGKVNAFLLVDGYTDTLSGVKDIKFAYSHIDENLISSYFKTNGYKIYDNVIEIEEKEKYFTIYIEDNVGNYSALYYELSDDLYDKITEDDNNEEPKTYVVSYDLNGGEGTFAPQLINIGETATLHSKIPTKNGYTFSGWKAEDGTIYQAGTTYDKQKNVVLKAQWSSNNNQITADMIKTNPELYIGAEVEYTGYSETQDITWRIFNVTEDGTIQLITDSYVNLTYKGTAPATNIVVNGYSISSSDNRNTLINYLKNSNNWSEYAVAGKTTAVGAATIEEFCSSYKLKYPGKYLEYAETTEGDTTYITDGANADGYVVRVNEAGVTDTWEYLKTIETTDTFYVKTETSYDSNTIFGYWLASNSARLDDRVMYVNYEGRVSHAGYISAGEGVRPIVSLTSNASIVEANGLLIVQ